MAKRALLMLAVLFVFLFGGRASVAHAQGAPAESPLVRNTTPTSLILTEKLSLTVELLL